MTNASPLDKHLAPGERVLWTGDFVDQLYLRALYSKLTMTVFLLLLLGAAATVFGFVLADLLQPEPPPPDVPPTWRSASYDIDLSRPFGAPLCLVALIVSAFMALIQIVRVAVLLNSRALPKARAFVVTSKRLLALNSDGALLDQASEDEIAGLEPISRDNPHNLIVRRRHNNASVIPFYISWVAHPAEAKAIIEQTFLPPPPPPETP